MAATTRPKRFTPVWARFPASLAPVATLIAALGYGCGSSSPSAPSASPPPVVAPPSPTATRYHVSGVVTDDAGSPIPGARFSLAYSPGGEFSSTPASCSFGTCFIHPVTDGNGHYDAAFEPGFAQVYGAYGAGVLWLELEGFEPNIQLLPIGRLEIVQNLRLRRVRSVDAGQSIALSIEPDYSSCSDGEDWWILTSRCESLTILAGQAGTLTIEARATEPRGIVPVVFFATTGRYTTRQSQGPGTVSVGVEAGEQYRFFVGVPSAITTRVDVTTSLR